MLKCVYMLGEHPIYVDYLEPDLNNQFSEFFLERTRECEHGLELGYIKELLFILLVVIGIILTFFAEVLICSNKMLKLSNI